MTILFISHYSGFYGAAKSMLALILDLRERYGVESIVLLPSKGPLCEELKTHNIKYNVSHYYWWVNDNKGIFQYLLNKRKQLLNLFKINRICKQLENEDIDIVYSNSVTINIGMFLAKKMKLPHVWHFRESLVQFNLSLSLSLSLSKYLLVQPINSAYIMISEYMMRYYRSYLPTERMNCIYNGVSLPANISRVESNLVKKTLKLACVGVVCEQKNQLELLKAINILKQKNILVEVYIIGTHKKEYLKLLTDYVIQNELTDRVHFIGHVDNVWKVLQEMNIGVVCAKDEAFGRTTIEFMLMHMPVIVSNSGANPELIAEKTGMIYELGDEQMLASHIESYYNHPKQITSDGDNAYEHAVKHFSKNQNTDNIYNLIQSIK